VFFIFETKIGFYYLPFLQKITFIFDVVFSDKLEENLSRDLKMLGSKGLLPSHIKTPEDFCLVSLTAIELGVTPLMGINNIFPVNGKPTLMANLRNALIMKAGIYYEIIQDYVPLYKYKDMNGVPYENKEILNNLDRYQIVTDFTKPEVIDHKKLQVTLRPINITIGNITIQDKITTVKAIRKMKDGSLLESTRSFTLSEAYDAQLIQTKDNWQKYPKDMCLARCKRRVSDDIAPDILFGMPDTIEMLDATNTKYTQTEEGTITVIESNKNISAVETPTIDEIKTN
jgi:hypothetical protein